MLLWSYNLHSETRQNATMVHLFFSDLFFLLLLLFNTLCQMWQTFPLPNRVMQTKSDISIIMADGGVAWARGVCVIQISLTSDYKTIRVISLLARGYSAIFPSHWISLSVIIVLQLVIWSDAPLCNMTLVSPANRWPGLFCLCIQASECVCADSTVVPACRRQQNLCSPSPCFNNATCVSKGNDYVCRWNTHGDLIKARVTVPFLDYWNVLQLCLSLTVNKKLALFLLFYPYVVIMICIWQKLQH